jgi:predicted Zn finger-like uncharacterized protein
VRFTCPTCETRYILADDKIPAAPALRFTCKKCNNAIRVRRNDGMIEPDGPGGAAIEPQVDATRLASLAEMNATAKSSVQADVEWFVLIAGEQRGPYSGTQVGELRRDRQIDERTYVWRDGMAEWLRLGSVVELAKVGVSPAPMPQEATVAMGKAQLQAELQKLRAGDDAPQAAAPSSLAPKPAPAKAAPTVAKTEVARTETSPVLLAKTATPPVLLAKTEVRAPAGMASGGEDSAAPIFGAWISEAAAEPLPPDDAELSPFNRQPSGAYSLGGEDFESAPAAPAGAQGSEDYQNAPPGESTKVFMSTAGLFRRQRNNRIAAVTAGAVLAFVIGIISLDLAGAYTIPGMGIIYDMAGVDDPNIERAVARVENQLHDTSLPDADREELRKKLLGLETVRQSKKGPRRAAAGATPTAAAAAQQGIVDKKTLAPNERSLAADIFSDDRKKETGIKLVQPSDIQTPNLPEGLSQEAIYKVINDNARSMKLCLEEAFKKGEKPTGKMEVQLTIAPVGSVADAQIVTPQFRASTIASCTIRRVKGWKFPRWNGEPVTVVFPYVLSAGF